MGRRKKEVSYFDTHISWTMRMPRKMVADMLECFHKEKLYRETHGGKKYYLTDVMKELVSRHIKEYAITEMVRSKLEKEDKAVEEEVIRACLSQGEPKE